MAASNEIRELRVALTVDDFDEAVRLYRDGLGLSVVKAWDEPTGRGVILAAGQATLELIDRPQAEFIDQAEVGQRVAGPVRLALEFPDIQSAITAARAMGARLVHDPAITPWDSLNARLEAPDGMQITFFQQPR
ncbi:MAG: VOC family protein [Anaerolineae bacterium]|nr:VOC family protein [Anaerolineae bacterium]